MQKRTSIMLKQTASFAALFIAVSLGISGLATAWARTPLKSPEQLAQDEILFARASRSIQTAAMKCYLAPPIRQQKPMTIRFFLARNGKQVSQLQVLKASPAASAMRRAAFRAIRNCAPYTVPDELRNWGGFWATVRLE
jgi:hypothetical protein